jgi:tetratricopeptide (TPR) repeat protein
VIQEFHISITPVGEDSYWLRTEAVAAGVPLAETQVTWPVKSWLKQTESLFQDPLNTLFSHPYLGQNALDAQGHSPGQEPAWIQLGKSLYQHLFQDRIRDSWLAAQGIAQHRRQTLRLRLGFKDSRLQRLPWELLYGDDRPLATGLDVSLCRYYQALGVTDLTATPPLSERSAPINVLVVISAPNDQERLSLRSEVQTLIDDLQGRAGKPSGTPSHNSRQTRPIDLNLTILEQPGRPELAHALEQGQFQVLHYAGHSDVSETGGELYLVNRQTGLTDGLSGEDLAGLLVNNGIRLAVFNSCRGAYTAADDAEAGWREQNLVQALVNRGVPGVIAMAERIPDDVAVTFTRLLYRNLQQGYSIDLCLSRVRQGLISAYRSDQAFWMLPILYLRPDFDGYLYTSPIEANSELEDLATSLNEGPLVPPDYSADPDISGLAEEVLTGHVMAALPDLETEAQSSPVIPLATDSLQTEPPDEALNSLFPDLITALEQQSHPEDRAESATVNGLIQQLSHPAQQNLTAPEPVETPAAEDENLLPEWSHPSTDLQGKLPADPQDAANTRDSAPSPSPSTDRLSPQHYSQETKPWRKPHSIPRNLAAWIGLGVFGSSAILILAVTVLTRLGNDTPPAVVVEPTPHQEIPPITGEPQPHSVGRNSSVISSAVAALASDKPEVAAKIIHQLLDQGDVEAALGILGYAGPDQLLEPEIAFVRGRLAWQSAVTGQEVGTIFDARRYWIDAVEADPDFIEAWVALGFVNYQMGDFDAALKAWQRAVDIDRQQLRDGDPSGQLRFMSKVTSYAYAGLAMVNLKLGELNPLEEQREQYQQRAKAYFDQVITLQPRLLDPNALTLEWWIWSPELIKSWQTAVDRISTSSGSEAP